MALLVLITGLSVSAEAQRSIASTNPQIAHEFVRAAFPGLRGHRFAAQVTLTDDFDRDLADWAVASLSVHTHDPNVVMHSRRVLSGRFEFVDGRIREAHFDGEYVNSELRKKTAAELLRTKNWTSDDTIKVFAKSGAHLATQSSEEFLREVKLAQFEDTLGRITAVRARFVAVPPVRALETDSEFEPFWLVTIEVSPHPDLRRRYDLTFEPFNGRLTSIVELR